MVLLFLFGLYLLALVTAIKNYEELVNISSVDGWYNGLGQCMLRPNNTITDYTWLFDYCRGQVTDPILRSGNEKAFKTLTTEWSPFIVDSTKHTRCCTSEVPVRERGFIQGFEGFTDPLQKPIMKLIHYLDKNKKFLIFLGDSTSSQMFHALFAELDREDSSMLHKDITTDFKKRYNDSLLLDLDPIYAVFQWRNVLVFDIKLFSFDLENRKTDINVANKLLPNLLHISPHGSFVIANIGHHLRYLNLHSYRPMLVERIGDFLNWLAVIKGHQSGPTVIYRETAPGHFDSTDGTYEAVDNATVHNNEFSNWNSPNTWDNHLPLYHCRPLFDHVTNRAENEIARSLIRVRGLQFPVLNLFRYFAPYVKIHNGNCYPDSEDRRPQTDCVHQCSFVPLMWMLIWVGYSIYIFFCINILIYQCMCNYTFTNYFLGPASEYYNGGGGGGAIANFYYDGRP